MHSPILPHSLPPSHFSLTPCSTVSENGAHTAKSTSSNGSYHAYANPVPTLFLSSSLPPLTSHQVSPRIPPPITLTHYEVDNNHRQSHVYDQPAHKASTMPPPLPYEVPMVSSLSNLSLI